MNLHDVLRAVILADAALLNDAKWVERAVRAIAAHEAKYPSPAVQAAPEPAPAPDARDDEIADLKARLAAAQAAAPAEVQPADPRDAELAELRAQLAAAQAGAEGSPA